MKPNHQFILASAAAIALVALASQSIAIEIPVEDDARVISNVNSNVYQNKNWGAEAYLGVCSVPPLQNTYLRFDWAEYLPVGTTVADIQKATLRLYVSILTTPGNFQVFPVTQTWQEGKGNNTVYTGGVTYLVQPASGTPSKGIWAVHATDLYEYVLLDVTDWVKSWLTPSVPPDPSATFGIVLKPQGAINVNFDSKEGGHQPVLDVTLNLPRTAPRGDLSMGQFTAGARP